MFKIKAKGRVGRCLRDRVSGSDGKHLTSPFVFYVSLPSPVPGLDSVYGLDESFPRHPGWHLCIFAFAGACVCVCVTVCV